MVQDLAASFRPIAPPRVIENVYSDDQYKRLLGVVQEHGPWEMILAHHFKSPEEVLATTSGSVPEGFRPTWDMFLSPVFRGYLGESGACLYPEIADCYYNTTFMDMARAYWGAEYAKPELMLFNIQGPCGAGGSPHLDGTWFRGLSMDNAPVWLLNTMSKSGLFTHWQAKKAQVIAWYYKGGIGGGFHYWADGPRTSPKTLEAPMWGRGVVVENERMYHSAQACGPVEMRRPEGLDISSKMGPDPENPGGWVIANGDKVIQRIPEEEFRFLVHWGAEVFMDYADLKRSLDHSDDITLDRAVEMFVTDLKQRGVAFEVPSDPLHDTAFIDVLTRTYDLGRPSDIPEEPSKPRLAA